MGIRILSREDIENREYELLAPYAMKSRESMGRAHKEDEHAYRSVYQRDKDRIIYSTAFRRLEYKTQVFVNHEGDYYRTRLTHTLEVAQIARTIARALRLNEELVEAIALVHDVGHTPFGHAGEDTLMELMKDHGGFDHNSHGLRVVDLLEERYPDFPGLNLSSEVRRGIIKHSTPFDLSRCYGTDVPGPWLLEIQVVDVADEIAYDNHDIDDGLKSGLLADSDLEEIPLWEEVARRALEGYGTVDQTIRRAQMIRALINAQVSDIIGNSIERLERSGIQSIDELAAFRERLVEFSDEMNRKRAHFREVLLNKLYRHYRVIRMSNKASRFLKSLFHVYADDPGQLPPNVRDKMTGRGEYRAICDYIAGMTDRYALDQYKKLFEPYERV
ncbi:MAG: deoxyguanosinetriphosphate triphosphohydrolase [Candidatus Omnitrophica bacterium]|nr:deoxyguanosinetriphosphate triphosphohydrolase [Candidatus Omnitrophota bacterium]